MDPFTCFSEDECRQILAAAREAFGGSLTADQARDVLAWAIERDAAGVSVAVMVEALAGAGETEDAA